MRLCLFWADIRDQSYHMLLSIFLLILFPFTSPPKPFCWTVNSLRKKNCRHSLKFSWFENRMVLGWFLSVISISELSEVWWYFKKKYPIIFNNKYPTISLLVKDQHFLENDFFPGDVSVQGQWKIYFSFEFQSGPSPLVGVVFILHLL